MIFGIAMGGEWGLGASLALESVSPKYRGFISGLLQEGYGGRRTARSACVSLCSYPDFGWRPLFLIGGTAALLRDLYSRESERVTGVARAQD